MKGKKERSRWKRWKGGLIRCLPGAVFFLVTACPVAAKEETEAVIVSEEENEFPGSIREDGLEKQVLAYYEAEGKGDLEKMTEARGMEDRERQIRIQVLSENGMSDIQVTRMVVYPADERQIVIVSYDMYLEGVEQGKKVKLPGLETFLTEPDKEGGWVLFEEVPKEAEEEMADRIMACWDREEVGDWINEINRAYEEALKDSPETVEWIDEVREKLGKELSEELAKELEMQERHYYTVKKGDSLWRIAGELLGDGTEWKKLYEENRELIGENPDLILPGTELAIARQAGEKS